MLFVQAGSQRCCVQDICSHNFSKQVKANIMRISILMCCVSNQNYKHTFLIGGLICQEEARCLMMKPLFRRAYQSKTNCCLGGGENLFHVKELGKTALRGFLLSLNFSTLRARVCSRNIIQQMRVLSSQDKTTGQDTAFPGEEVGTCMHVRRTHFVCQETASCTLKGLGQSKSLTAAKRALGK